MIEILSVLESLARFDIFVRVTLARIGWHLLSLYFPSLIKSRVSVADLGGVGRVGAVFRPACIG